MPKLADIAIRFAVFAAVTLLAVVSTILAFRNPAWLIPLAIAGPLALLGVRDLLQTRHTLMRNYPVIAYFRWIMEALRPYPPLSLI